jgi:hypothetical protein
MARRFRVGQFLLRFRDVLGSNLGRHTGCSGASFFLSSKYRDRRLSLKCDCTCAGTRFRLSAKRTSPFKRAGASVQSSTGSRGVRISCSNVGYTMFRGSVKGTGNPLHSPVSPSLPLPCVNVCHHVSTGLYFQQLHDRLLPQLCNSALSDIPNIRRHVI